MSDILEFEFNKNNFSEIKNCQFCENWPVVYIINNNKEAYIGETINAYMRSIQHYDNPERRKLDKINIIIDDEYNKSATLDIESSLIQYISADGKFILQNSNKGLRNHDYYNRAKYQEKFQEIWNKLQSKGLVRHTIEQIRNSDLFKYSPYKNLTNDQMLIADRILKEIISKKEGTFMITGAPGTGKTILAAYLFKRLKEEKEIKDLKAGFVVPMGGLRGTMKKIFKNIKGLKANMVIGPSDILKEDYDILIIDEAHRLRQRRNIVNFRSFDQNNKILGLDKGEIGTELDWIMKSSRVQILFYDKNQSVMPADVPAYKFDNLKVKNYELTTQMRLGWGAGGHDYLKFINETLDIKKITQIDKLEYDFQIYDNLESMVSDIKSLNQKHDLCRVVAGYSWPWISKSNPSLYDIEIGDVKLRWNSVRLNWPYSSNAINEVGCIHTIQGYDLNYAGVIIGPEISYDNINKKIVINRDLYHDKNGKRGVMIDDELLIYIVNIYRTLLTRGIYGTYVYIVDDKLRSYFKSSFKKLNPQSIHDLSDQIIN